MRYRVFEGGAIACALVALGNWTTASPHSPPSPCQPTPAQNPHQRKPRQPHCSSTQSIVQAGLLPTTLLNLGWGRDRLSADLEQVYTKVLADAQQLADAEHLPEAILALGGIPKNSQQFSLARQMQQDWSQELLQQATQHYSQAELKTALHLLASIPATSPLFQQAKALLAQWRQEANWLRQAQMAAQAGRWPTVLATLQRLESRPLYQSTPVQTLLQSTMSHIYQPDDRLLKVTSSSSPSTTSVRAQMPQIPVHPAAIETLPDSQKLEIATPKALTWAQPQNDPAIAQTAPPKQPEPVPTQPSQTLPTTAPLFPLKLPQRTAIEQLQKPAIAPPESFLMEE